MRAWRPYGEQLAELSRHAGFDLPADALDDLAAHSDARVLTRSQQRQSFTFPAAASQCFWIETYQHFRDQFLPDADALRLADVFRALLS